MLFYAYVHSRGLIYATGGKIKHIGTVPHVNLQPCTNLQERKVWKNVATTRLASMPIRILYMYNQRCLRLWTGANKHGLVWGTHIQYTRTCISIRHLYSILRIIPFKIVKRACDACRFTVLSLWSSLQDFLSNFKTAWIDSGKTCCGNIGA